MKIPALLNGKDICPEFEWLFDGEKSVSQNYKELGFIDGVACITTYRQNTLIIRVIGLNLTDNDLNIIEHSLVNEIEARLDDVCSEVDFYAEVTENFPGLIYVNFYWKDND